MEQREKMLLSYSGLDKKRQICTRYMLTKSDIIFYCLLKKYEYKCEFIKENMKELTVVMSLTLIFSRLQC